MAKRVYKSKYLVKQVYHHKLLGKYPVRQWNTVFQTVKEEDAIEHFNELKKSTTTAIKCVTSAGVVLDSYLDE